jgi:DNA-binding winged helix-turn-helix (wHTH) protein
VAVHTHIADDNVSALSFERDRRSRHNLSGKHEEHGSSHGSARLGGNAAAGRDGALMFSSVVMSGCYENVTAAEHTEYQFDTVEVRPRTFQVLRDGQVLALEPKSVRVLIYLIEHRDRAVGKDELLGAVWQDAAVTDNALTRVIAQVRRELGDDAREPRYIQTIPTVGYRFVAQIHSREPTAPTPPLRRGQWVPVIAAVALVVVLAAAWLLSRQDRTPPSSPGASNAQVTTSPGLDMAPSFSPDGTAFAYSSDRTGRFEIYIRQLRGAAGETQITNDGAQNVQPAWSPDGGQIAYHSVVKRGIWIVPASGGFARQVVESGSQPAWSPDSSRIAYSSADVFSLSVNDLVSASQTAIRVVPAAGGQPVEVARTSPNTARQFFPSWSPDGKHILFSSATGGAGELWIVAPDGSGLRRLLSAHRNLFLSPKYNRAGDSIYYGALSKSRDFGIWEQKISSGKADGEPVRSRAPAPQSRCT